jgi:hypothetical protein
MVREQPFDRFQRRLGGRPRDLGLRGALRRRWGRRRIGGRRTGGRRRLRCQQGRDTLLQAGLPTRPRPPFICRHRRLRLSRFPCQWKVTARQSVEFQQGGPNGRAERRGIACDERRTHDQRARIFTADSSIYGC